MLLLPFVSALALNATPNATVPEVGRSQADYLAFLAMGDWGEPGNLNQLRKVANVMNQACERTGAQFVTALGDNFYSAGVNSINDPKWKTVWEDVYKGKVGTMPWYVVMGNHDWYGNHRAQIEYSRVNSRWIMPDYFYDREFVFGNTKAAILFLDTDLLFYGYKGTGDPNYPGNQLKPNFEKMGWTESSGEFEKQLQWVQDKLRYYQYVHHLIVVGHHDMVTCGTPSYGMQKLKELFDQYRISAYVYGHKHALGSAKSGNTWYFLTGAGGQTMNSCSQNGAWGAGNRFGFMIVKLYADQLVAEFIDDSGSILRTEVAGARK
jgi:acid phosphatase